MLIDVRKYLPEIEERIFVRPRGFNKAAAAYRYSIAESILEDWFGKINSEKADNKDIPSDLADMYEQAGKLIAQIAVFERDIVTGDRAR